MKIITILTAMLLLLPVTVLAQDADCAAVATALATAADACSEIGSHEICLGYGRVEAAFNCETPPVFESPGDTASLDVTCTVRTGAPSGEWGIAVMTAQPTGAEQAVTYFLLGDVEMQNAATSRQRQTATALSDIEIYSQPVPPYVSIGQLAAGDTIDVNACNCTRHWLRTVLADGRVGWLLARTVELSDEAPALPVVTTEAPIYASMQAFNVRSGQTESACATAPEDGILIQLPAALDTVQLQINGVAVQLTSSIFVQAQPGGALTIAVLDGSARVTTDVFTASVPAGTRAVVPLSDENIADGRLTRVEVLPAETVARLPLSLLPETIDPAAALLNVTPVIVGLEPCAVRSDRGETTCPLHFINPDGDTITRMEVEFVQAPQGTWTGSVTESPAIIAGDATSGALAWKATCSLGSANFIGPVQWSIRLTDSAGHVSEPFPAAFNCIEG